ncbi:hypothetical protein KIW84_066512 [Lathyrus oleraceus]|uniref:Uncharacterized protein n=1 Tax=Pisum sativum TaxID=3888 RepID=A0A9D5A8P4_PEA|nr:hypothetical protein KIW84_066512 [Pisum sativum]
MNGASSNESVNPWSLSMFNCIPSPLNILLITSGETTNDRDITVFVDSVSDFSGNHFNGFEVVFRGSGKSSLNDIYTKLRKLASNVEFFLGSHGGSGGLFAVAESGVEDANIGRVRDVVGDVRRTLAKGFWLGLGLRLRLRLRLRGAGNGEFGFRGMREMEAEERLVL